MSDISHLIKMLQNEDHTKRFEACEELRISQPPLPQEAIDALAIATNDKNLDVSEAAIRALALHAPNVHTFQESKIPNSVLTTNAPTSSKSKIGITGVIIVTIIITLFGCIAIFSDTSPEGYERNGNLIMAAVVLVALALIIILPLIWIFIIAVGTRNSKSKTESPEKPEQSESKKDYQDILPIAVIAGIILIITLCMSLPYLLP